MPLNTNRFFLNALRDDIRALATPDTGRWKDDSGGKDFLVKYAQDIHLTGEIRDSHAAHSVPSAYARPIQFHQALADERSPLHATMVGEWRGLLAVVALQDYAGFNLSVVSYDVPELDSKAKSEVGSVGRGDLHLRTMLRNQLPRPANDWTRWWMIYCDDHLIGATSPWTMVYTPAQYVCPANVPWQEKGILYDPIRVYDPRGNGKSRELSILQRWVALTLNEREQRWGMPERLDEKVNTIAGELAVWARDLNRYADRDLKVSAFVGTRIIDEPPFADFLRTADAVDVPKGSDLLLKSAKLGEKRNVLALAPSRINRTDRINNFVLAEQLDFEAIKKIGKEGQNFLTKSGKEIALEYVFVEDVFFPAKLMELTLTDTALQRGTANFALPLTPAFFKYFDHEELRRQEDMLTVAENEKAVRVTLRVPLKSGKNLTIEKVYDRASDVVKTSPSPVFALWPEFYATDWEENYAAYVADVGSKQEDIRATPVFADGTGHMTPAAPDTTQKDLRIWRCPQAPIGFSLEYRDKGSDSLYQAGVVLRDRLMAPVDVVEDNEWEVGVDFGTSSTTVYARKNQHDPELLPVTARLRYLTKSTPDWMTIVADNLYPSETVMPPFRTLLYDSQATLIGSTARFTLRFVFSPTEEKPPYGNVKWATRAGKAETEPLTEYLQGIVRYVAAEARAEGVGKLHFHWSYPLSLPSGVLNGMRDFWKSVGNTYSRAAALTPDQATRLMQVSVDEGISESEALCRCLADLNSLDVHAGALTVAVDVGGGSTDVGFWISKDLLGQFSFKLAGNDVMTPTWLRIPNFLANYYRACTGADLPTQEADYVQSRATVYLNNLLSFARDTTGKLYTGLDPRFHPVPLAIHRGPAGDTPWLQFRSLAYLFYTGVAYYVGVHARKFPPPVKEMKVYFGGRGSAFLSWLSADEKKIVQVLREAIQLGLGQPLEDHEAKFPAVTVELLGPPLRFDRNLPPMKHEVALGMERKPLKGKVHKGGTTLVGEKGWKLNGEVVEWSTEVSADQLGELELPPNFETSFVAGFREFLKSHSELNLDLEGFQKLKVKAGRVSSCVKKTSIDSQELQPVFACELRSLMEQYVANATGAGDDANASTAA